MAKLRSSAPLILSTTAGLVAAGLMFVPRGDAAPLPAAYSAKAAADVWHIDDLDLDMDGDIDDLDLSVTRAEGVSSASLNPRSVARAENVAGTSATGQAVRRGAVSSAGESTDTSAPIQGSAPAGGIAGVVDLDQAVLSSRGRWVGDTSCLPAGERLTDSRASTTGSRLVATDVPEPDPTVTIPIVDVEVPLPPGGGPLPPLPDSGLPPTNVPGLPTDLPTHPTEVPTWVPTITESPTIPTDLPVPTDLPTLVPLPTDLPAPTGLPMRAVQDVVLAEVAGGAVEQHTWLAQKSADPDVRGVKAEALGTMTNLSQPAIELFDGEMALQVKSQPKLTAYADGVNPGLVTWTPPQLALLVSGQATPLNVPANGEPVRVSYSRNAQLVVSISAGQLTKTESPDGTSATGKASAARITITRATDAGEVEVLDAELLPMTVEVKSPVGGVECRVAQLAPKAKLVGKSIGKKKDKLTVAALPAAEGASVKLFRVTKGKQKKVGQGVLGANGKRAFKIKDKNGKKKTTYVAKLSATDLTLAGTAKKKLR